MGKLADANDMKRAITGADAKAGTKRPDVVHVRERHRPGCVLELKRSTVSVSEGIRQSLDNQKKAFIQPFFSTLQWVMAGNDREGLRYAAIETPEKYTLRWVEESGPDAGELNRPESRALIITDLTELDEQIDKLNGTEQSLLCPLVHKFGSRGNARRKTAKVPRQ